jgi:hypothetical protein
VSIELSYISGFGVIQ